MFYYLAAYTHFQAVYVCVEKLTMLYEANLNRQVYFLKHQETLSLFIISEEKPQEVKRHIAALRSLQLVNKISW